MSKTCKVIVEGFKHDANSSVYAWGYPSHLVRTRAKPGLVFQPRSFISQTEVIPQLTILK